MGDRRFLRLYDRVQRAEDPAQVIRELTDEQVVSALAATSQARDPYLANVLATEAHNRLAQRERLERRLEENEQRHRSLFEYHWDPVFAFDLEGTIISCNASCERVSGWKREEMLGEPFVAFLHEGDVEAAMGQLEEVLGGNPQRGEFRIRHRDGSLIVAHVTSVPMTVDGEVVGVINVARDVTTEKRALQALQESEERFRLVARSVQDIVWDWDLRTGRVWRSDMYQRAFGYAPDAVASQPEWWDERLHPEDRERVVASEQAWLHGSEDAWQAEYRFRRADGSYAHVLDNGYVVRNGEGEPVRAVGVLVDLTERRRREEALRRQEAFQRTLLGSLSDLGSALIVFDGERVVHANNAFERVTGYSAEELGGFDGLLAIVAPEHRDEVAEGVGRWLRGEAGAMRRECDLFTKEGARISVAAAARRHEVGGDARVVCLFHDVTARKRQEEALRKSEERVRTLFENVPIGLYRTTPDGEYLDANPALVRMLGFDSLEALRAVNARELYADPGERARWRRHLERDGEGDSFEVRMRRRGGATLWVRYHARVVRDDAGRTLYFEGAVEDITEQRRAEAALRGAHRSLKNLVDACPDPIIAVDPDLTVTMWNPAAERVFGWSAEEVLGHHYPIVPDAFEGEHVALHDRVIEGEALRSVETVRQRKDGSLLDVSISTAPLRDARGAVSGAMVVLRDVTARRRQEAALRESEARYRGLFEGVPVGLYRTTPGGVFLDVNAALVDLLGYPSREELLGVSAHALYADPRDREAWRARLERDGVATDVEVRLRRHDGGLVWVRESARVVRDSRGDVVCFEGAVEDVTERKRAEEEVRRLNGELGSLLAERTRSLQTASAALDAYDHRVAHDLDARLRAVDFLSEVLIEDYGDALPGEAREFVARLRRESHALTGLANGLLDLRRERRPATR